MNKNDKLINLGNLQTYDKNIKNYIKDTTVQQAAIDNVYNDLNGRIFITESALKNNPRIFYESTFNEMYTYGLQGKMGFRANESLSRTALKEVPLGSTIRIKENGVPDFWFAKSYNKNDFPNYDNQLMYVTDIDIEPIYAKINAIKADIEKAQNKKIETKPWDGIELTAPNGNGSEMAPYMITSGAEYAWIVSNWATIVANPIYIQLEKDIDLNGYDPGYISTSIAVHFDGKGYAIYNFHGRTGLFYNIGANSSISNLTLIKAYVDHIYGNPGLTAGGFVSIPKGAITFTNCHLDNTSTIIGSGNHVGGFVGSCNFTGGGLVSFSNCTNASSVYNSGARSANINAGYGAAGGFAGSFENVQYILTDCYNFGNIASSDVRQDGIVGAIAGFCKGTDTGTLTRCFNFGLLYEANPNINTTAAAIEREFIGGHMISSGNYDTLSITLIECYGLSDTDYAHINNYLDVIGKIPGYTEKIEYLTLQPEAVPDYSWFFFNGTLVNKGNSASDPYIISTPEMLLGLQFLSNGTYDINSEIGQYVIENNLVTYINDKPVVYFDNKYFSQIANFDLSQYGHFEPIASTGLWTRIYERFYYDGLYHSIKGLTQIIPAGENVRTCGGLFGYVGRKGGEIRNLNMISANIEATADAGGLVAVAGEGFSFINCNIDRNSKIYSHGYRIVDGQKLTMNSSAGGLVGYVNGTHGFFDDGYDVCPIQIANCYSEASVFSTSCAGGIAGIIQAPKHITFKNCLFNGIIIVWSEDGVPTSKYTSVGGIFADIETESASAMENEFGVVPGDEALKASIVIDHCCNTGALITFAEGAAGKYMGGIAGNIKAHGIETYPSDISLISCSRLGGSLFYTENAANVYNGGIVAVTLDAETLDKFTECFTCLDNLTTTVDIDSNILIESCNINKKMMHDAITTSVYYGLMPVETNSESGLRLEDIQDRLLDSGSNSANKSIWIGLGDGMEADLLLGANSTEWSPRAELKAKNQPSGMEWVSTSLVVEPNNAYIEKEYWDDFLYEMTTSSSVIATQDYVLAQIAEAIANLPTYTGKTITFSITGTTTFGPDCIAEENMTWAEWVNSEYNTETYWEVDSEGTISRYIDYTNEETGASGWNQLYICREDTSSQIRVVSTDLINENEAYRVVWAGPGAIMPYSEE